MKRYECLIGSYAERSEEGVLRYEVNFETGVFEKIDGTAGLLNPSYLCIDEEKKLVYAVEEMDREGALAVIDFGAGQAEIKSETATGGAHPCHVTEDALKKYLAVGNYSADGEGGSIALFGLDKSGMPERRQVCYHKGSGPNLERQSFPHVHFSSFRGDNLLVCDLGTDTVCQYRLNRTEDCLEETDENIHFPAGTGPRHLCFDVASDDWVYVACELDGYVRVLHRENGRYVFKQEADSLPMETTPEQRCENRTAAIKMTQDGNYLLVTNRGDDSASLFKVGEDRLLTIKDIVKTGAVEPRELTLFDDYILIGHQSGKCITAMKLDRETEKLKIFDMRLDMDVSPVCILNITGCG
ncbi:MAG: lactonase family protein [Lachnospiraceae bacterium]|nr:lactonase family protein [Lachnospiraceae bacterium]